MPSTCTLYLEPSTFIYVDLTHWPRFVPPASRALGDARPLVRRVGRPARRSSMSPSAMIWSKLMPSSFHLWCAFTASRGCKPSACTVTVMTGMVAKRHWRQNNCALQLGNGHPHNHCDVLRFLLQTCVRPSEGGGHTWTLRLMAPALCALRRTVQTNCQRHTTLHGCLLPTPVSS